MAGVSATGSPALLAFDTGRLGAKPVKYTGDLRKLLVRRPRNKRKLECAAVDRCRLATLLLLVDIATVDPRLHADDPVRGVRFGEPVVDVRAQGMQRQTALQIPLRAGNLITVQAARHADLDPLATEPQSRIHALAHRTAEADALLQLQSNVLAHQLSIELWLVHLEDVDKHLAASALLDVGLQLVDLRALATDDDARARGANDQPQLVAWPFHFHRANAGSLELLAELCLQLHVLDQQLVVAALDKPA